MPKHLLFAAALVASLILAVACGGAGGKPTATKVSTRVATTSITRTPASTGTATVTQTPAPGPAATEPAGQPTLPPAATEPPVVQPTDTPAPGSTTVTVSLVEFAVQPNPASAPSGTVTFNAQNNGTIPHNFFVIKTDLSDDALPVNQSTYTVDTSQLYVVAQTPNIRTEDTRPVTLDLSPGHYVLICNIVDHYQIGMHVSFNVQ
jgi:uncharacterized cupredoxin-like copper-binding protein